MDAHGTVTAEEWGSLPPGAANFVVHSTKRRSSHGSIIVSRSKTFQLTNEESLCYNTQVL